MAIALSAPSIGLFFREILMRALQETWHVLSPRLLSIVIGLFLNVLAIALYAISKKGFGSSVTDKIHFFLMVLLANVAAVILIFIVNLCRAPYLLYRDQAVQLESLEKKHQPKEECPPPPIPPVTPPVKRQCTEYSLDVPTDHNVAPGAEHGQTIFVFCNQKTSKPFNLSLEFDGQFINSIVPNILGNRVWPLSYNRLAPLQNSAIYKVEMNSELNAYQPMVVTVYSAEAISLKRGCLDKASLCK